MDARQTAGTIILFIKHAEMTDEERIDKVQAVVEEIWNTACEAAGKAIHDRIKALQSCIREMADACQTVDEYARHHHVGPPFENNSWRRMLTDNADAIADARRGTL